MLNKKMILGVVIFFVIIVFGLFKVNAINTKALSPIGNGEDNYKLVKEEFGADFEEFIKDDSDLKIYLPNQENKPTTIKFKGKEIAINKDNPVCKTLILVGQKFSDTFMGIKNKINGMINTEDKKSDEKELDKIINDYINDTKDNKNSDNNVTKQQDFQEN